ncbi:MAG TPA: acetyl-CoA carboxylase biotin carboxyl carrier protein [Candidatus Acidoferrales bacterium]|nr:acetyl-CoA carboxylase biotin carboxyl carrier protein [Candidatus Acidoferrales bacterium]
MAERKKARNTAPEAAEGVDLPDLERLLEFMGKHGLEELEYERDSFRVRLKKASHGLSGSLRSVAIPEIVVAAPIAAPAAPAPVEKETPADEAGRGEDLHVINSPIVGTFYSASNPGEKPFVRVGDRVKSGQVLCIIEAMKLMNEIEADVDGEVMRIYVENGQPVEYGEALFGIHPQRKK